METRRAFAIARGGCRIRKFRSWKNIATWGVCRTSTLDEKAHVDEMIAKMHRRTAIARPFLSDPSTCIAIRTSALRMCIIQPATWGAEWCGMKHPNASRLQAAANRAMRLVVVGCSVQSRATTALALGLELQIPSTEAIAAGCRACIRAKGSTMRTSLSRIFMQTPTHRKNSWMKSTQIWLKRLLGENTLPNLSPRNIEGSRRLKRTVQTPIWDRRHGTSRAGNAGFTLYRNYTLAYTCKYWREALEFPGLARGTQWLAKMRVGGFWLAAPALSRIGTLESHWESHCPCCGNETPETLTHLGLQWPRWKQERSELLEGQQQLGITVIDEGRTLTLSVALAIDGPLTEPQRSLVAKKLTCYLVGKRSSESDAHTGAVRFLRLPSVVGVKHKPALPTKNAFRA